MNGNDIVALKTAKIPEGSRGSRFFDKIFTYDEQEIINKGQIGVWSVWAMKEAVYKAHQRRFSLPRTFDPKKIKVHVQETSDNIVMTGADYRGYDYWGRGCLTSEYVHFTAGCLPKEQVYSEIYNTGSYNINSQLKLAVSEKLGLECKYLRIVKDKNHIPHLRYLNHDLNLPFSLSHHGNFAAFSFQLINY